MTQTDWKEGRMITDDELDKLIGLDKEARTLSDIVEELGMQEIPTRLKRQKYGVGYYPMGIKIPNYLMRIIDEEATEKGYTRSRVINYLLISAIRAHLGKFTPPKNNTIKKGIERRGEKW